MSGLRGLGEPAACQAAAALRAALATPAAAGARSTLFVDYSRPRRGEMLSTWANLPGLTLHAYHRAYTHALLPGWSYSVAELKTEMLDDLDHLAATGEQPKAETPGRPQDELVRLASSGGRTAEEGHED